MAIVGPSEFDVPVGRTGGGAAVGGGLVRAPAAEPVRSIYINSERDKIFLVLPVQPYVATTAVQLE